MCLYYIKGDIQCSQQAESQTMPTDSLRQNQKIISIKYKMNGRPECQDGNAQQRELVQLLEDATSQTKGIPSSQILYTWIRLSLDRLKHLKKGLMIP